MVAEHGLEPDLVGPDRDAAGGNRSQAVVDHDFTLHDIVGQLVQNRIDDILPQIHGFPFDFERPVEGMGFPEKIFRHSQQADDSGL